MLDEHRHRDGSELLSSLIAYTKYARHREDDNRRETWNETVMQRLGGSLHRRYPQLKNEIDEVLSLVEKRLILPSMRFLQFAGPALDRHPSRIYNCSYLSIRRVRDVYDFVLSLLLGTGVGYSVQWRHAKQMPPIKGVQADTEQVFTVEDTVEGWAAAFEHLFTSYTERLPRVVFDFTKIRPKGSPIRTAGGRAPGPDPLKKSLLGVQDVLDAASPKQGESPRRLRPLELLDAMCLAADCISAGGTRRSATICLFDWDDVEMLTSKSGAWYATHPWRCRANISAILHRTYTTREQYDFVYKYIRENNTGEPGIAWTNDYDFGLNPCFRGDMKLLTEDGYHSFASLEDRTLRLVNASGEVVSGRVWRSGKKKTVRVVRQLLGGVNAKSFPDIICTPDHVFQTVLGEECMAKDLKGKVIRPYLPEAKQHDPTWIRLGFLQGDGTLTDLNNQTKKGVGVNIGRNDDDLLDLFGLRGLERSRSYYLRGYSALLREHHFSLEKLPQRVLPTNIDQWGTERLSSFLCGLYSANGSVLLSAGRVTLKTTNEDLARHVLRLLAEKFDIKGYVTTNPPKVVHFPNGDYACKESYDVNLATHSAICAFAEQIGFVQKYKTNRLQEVIVKKSPVVIRVEEAEEEDVYDFELFDSTHWGVVNGVVAHNCAEISLRSQGFCNVSTVNGSKVRTQQHLNDLVAQSAFLGTLQAGYDHFDYLAPEWSDVCKEDALIGVSITGIAHGHVCKLDLRQAAHSVVQMNQQTSKRIGINKAKRTTCLKPEGTVSTLLSTSSGIHDYEAPFFFRSIEIGKSESIYRHLKEVYPALVEDKIGYEQTHAIIRIPLRAPEGAYLKSQSTALSLLERIRRYNREWIKEGHVSGANPHNVSCTVSVREEEWDDVQEWMWNNREDYVAIATFPYWGGTHRQLPFAACTEQEFQEGVEHIKPFDFSAVKEYEDGTSFSETVACAGNVCERL